MKKRLLSILLTLCMALSLLPTVAFAEGGAKAIQSGTGSIHGYDTSGGYIATSIMAHGATAPSNGAFSIPRRTPAQRTHCFC